MDKLTIPYLESLSAGELIELAGTYGLDIPPGLERFFIIEELFYLDHHEHGMDHGDINDPDGGSGEFKELNILPKHYHTAFVDVLIRDSLWVFVFWEMKTADRDLVKRTADFNSICLRVSPLKESSQGLSPRLDEAASFIIAVDTDDCGRYLGFPPEDGRSFKVQLCMLNQDNLTVLAESRSFALPCLIGPKAKNEQTQAVYGNALAQMSGVGSFSLVHSDDRVIRSRNSPR